mgnify:CR=1 FL=1
MNVLQTWKGIFEAEHCGINIYSFIYVDRLKKYDFNVFLRYFKNLLSQTRLYVLREFLTLF